MLINFRVKNFRSFRDEQNLSMVATKDKALIETNTISSGAPSVPNLLKSAVIFGANASGKSNLLNALFYMKAVVMTSSGKQPGDTYNVQSYRLDREFKNKPTSFDITFIENGIRYDYGFELTQERITSEYLQVYKTVKPQNWFQRHYNADTDEYHMSYGPGLTGPKKVWESSTTSNVLFLSRAIQLNSKVLLPVYNWFAENLVIFGDLASLPNDYTINMLNQEPARKLILDFLAAADTSINDISVESRKILSKGISIDLINGELENKGINGEQEIRELKFHHLTDNEEVKFDIDNESKGTQHLLSVIGPMLDIIDKGKTLIIDELDSSLHPMLVKRLLSLFHAKEHNSKGAQLIFSLHNTALLSSGIIRRDQIWFVEKDRNQASYLYPLSDFHPRKNEALENGYLAGRYGALPFFQNWEEL